MINDISGKENYRREISVEDERETLYDLDISVRLVPGVYFVSVTNNQNAIKEKLVVS